ncbi:DUF4214 domain-containing protein [Candidatus Njordibacter sp. Uisw_058]|jgi:hypothetical protein|uniref:DUF4214 domain-containing protein n=1 Tax=Candidatus Njordibacter sp. Uisw_058 TaxID=3230974 RepID=UPI003D59F874
MASVTSERQVQELYIAYFGRPADASGLAYYANELDKGTKDVAEIALGFGGSAEAAPIVALDTDKYVEALYLQAFGRNYNAETDSTFWVDSIASGVYTKEMAMVEILNGASGNDATAVANKGKVAATFTTAQETNEKAYNVEVLTAAKSLMSEVTAEAATLTTGTAAAEAAVDNSAPLTAAAAANRLYIIATAELGAAEVAQAAAVASAAKSSTAATVAASGAAAAVAVAATAAKVLEEAIAVGDVAAIAAAKTTEVNAKAEAAVKAKAAVRAGEFYNAQLAASKTATEVATIANSAATLATAYGSAVESGDPSSIAAAKSKQASAVAAFDIKYTLHTNNSTAFAAAEIATAAAAKAVSDSTTAAANSVSETGPSAAAAELAASNAVAQAAVASATAATANAVFNATTAYSSAVIGGDRAAITAAQTAVVAASAATAAAKKYSAAVNVVNGSVSRDIEALIASGYSGPITAAEAEVVDGSREYGHDDGSGLSFVHFTDGDGPWAKAVSALARGRSSVVNIQKRLISQSDKNDIYAAWAVASDVEIKDARDSAWAKAMAMVDWTEERLPKQVEDERKANIALWKNAYTEKDLLWVDPTPIVNSYNKTAGLMRIVNAARDKGAAESEAYKAAGGSGVPVASKTVTFEGVEYTFNAWGLGPSTTSGDQKAGDQKMFQAQVEKTAASFLMNLREGSVAADSYVALVKAAAEARAVSVAAANAENAIWAARVAAADTDPALAYGTADLEVAIASGYSGPITAAEAEVVDGSWVFGSGDGAVHFTDSDGPWAVAARAGLDILAIQNMPVSQFNKNYIYVQIIKGWQGGTLGSAAAAIAAEPAFYNSKTWLAAVAAVDSIVSASSFAEAVATNVTFHADVLAVDALFAAAASSASLEAVTEFDYSPEPDLFI